jgi:hypothetical protein
LRFVDGTTTAVTGLTEILAELYSEGRQASRETAEEIMARLEASKNYIPPSSLVRREYAHALLEEYRNYAAEHERPGTQSATRR